MSDKTTLNPSSSSFSFLEYFLQISLKATTARVKEAWALSNPHLTDLLILDSWVDCTALASPNSEDEIAKRGFQFSEPSNGMKFSVGSLRPLLKSDLKSSSKIVKKLLLCKVAVGRSYFAEEEYCKIGSIPEGYDSFYINPAKEAISKTKDDVDNDYFHEYMIKDSNQVLPLYLVTFEFDPTWEKKSRDKNYCDNCEKSIATVYCQADSAYLCSSCDVTLHSANKLVSRHIRTQIGRGPEVFGNCRLHTDKQVEFFCPSCHLPVCVYCKMVGHHSSGESARHKLVSVQEAYQTVLESSNSADPILQARKTAIENQLECINARAKLVDKNSNEVKQQIEDLYKKALNDLKVITKKKLTILKGDECELYRQLGEVNRLEQFLKYQQQGGDPTQFLLNWGRHLQLRAELHAFRFFRENVDVQADIKCGGNIHIHVDQSQASSSVKPMPNTPTAASTYTLAKKTPYEAITGGKPRLPASKPSTGKAISKTVTNQDGTLGVADDRTKVRRTSDFFAETLHALDLGSEMEGKPNIYLEINETMSYTSDAV